MTALALASPLGSPVPAAKTSTVVPITTPVAPLFSDHTLASAVNLLGVTSWNQGVDELAEIGELTASLHTDFRLLNSGVRNDEFIRGRASAALRQLSAKFRRDDKHELVSYDDFNMTALSHPDVFQAAHS